MYSVTITGAGITGGMSSGGGGAGRITDGGLIRRFHSPGGKNGERNAIGRLRGDSGLMVEVMSESGPRGIVTGTSGAASLMTEGLNGREMVGRRRSGNTALRGDSGLTGRGGAFTTPLATTPGYRTGRRSGNTATWPR